ncbi:hypothetical protein ACFLX2_00490 [Candidatus Dependentiae bacterium]
MHFQSKKAFVFAISAIVALLQGYQAQASSKRNLAITPDDRQRNPARARRLRSPQGPIPPGWTIIPDDREGPRQPQQRLNTFHFNNRHGIVLMSSNLNPHKTNRHGVVARTVLRELNRDYNQRATLLFGEGPAERHEETILELLDGGITPGRSTYFCLQAAVAQSRSRRRNQRRNRSQKWKTQIGSVLFTGMRGEGGPGYGFYGVVPLRFSTFGFRFVNKSEQRLFELAILRHLNFLRSTEDTRSTIKAYVPKHDENERRQLVQMGFEPAEIDDDTTVSELYNKLFLQRGLAELLFERERQLLQPTE